MMHMLPQLIKTYFIVIVCVLGLVAEGEKAQKQTGGLVVTKDLMGNIQHAHYVPWKNGVLQYSVHQQSRMQH